MPDRSDRGDDPDAAVLSRGSRRRLLRTLVNVGFGAGVASILGRTDLLPDETSIVYGLAWPDGAGRRRLTKEVPTSWEAGVQRAFDLQRTIIDAGLPGVVGTFVVPGDYGDPAPRLDVDVLPEVDGLGELDELLADIEYTINYVQPTKPDFGPQVNEPRGGRTVELDGDRVPGGTLCTADEYVATLAPATFDADGRRRFATANHVYGAEGTIEDDHRGEPLYLLHEDGETRIGSVHRGLPGADVVLLTPEGGYTPTREIDGTAPSRVAGHFTKVGLADLAARGEPLRKVGAMSGHSSGEIKGIDGVTCYYGDSCRSGQLKWGTRTAMTDGDSGSVSFHRDPQDPSRLLIGGFNNARTWWPGGDFTWGTAAYHVHDNYGLRF